MKRLHSALAFLLLGNLAHVVLGQPACLDFGKDIEGASIDNEGNFLAVNGAQGSHTQGYTT